jgi:hypothetical protein
MVWFWRGRLSMRSLSTPFMLAIMEGYYVAIPYRARRICGLAPATGGGCWRNPSTIRRFVPSRLTDTANFP